MSSIPAPPPLSAATPRLGAAPEAPPAPPPGASPAPAFVGRHAVPTYYLLAFAISGAAVLAVVGPGGLPATADDQRVAMGMAMLLGPSLAGLLLTGLVSGRAGYRDLLARLVRWRVGARWYAVALLTAPLVSAAVDLGHWLLSPSPAFLPAIVTADDTAFYLLFGLVGGLLIAAGEELGWTGFATPQLRLHHGVLTTALVMGVLWGAWHFPLFWERDSFSGALPLAVLLVRLFSWLPAYRALMVSVHDGTGSLLVLVLMHVSLVASTMLLQPEAQPGPTALTYPLGVAAALWAVVAAVAVARGKQPARQPRRPRVA
jgi:membrane protease YdiL (CAAX protease family)